VRRGQAARIAGEGREHVGESVGRQRLGVAHELGRAGREQRRRGRQGHRQRIAGLEALGNPPHAGTRAARPCRVVHQDAHDLGQRQAVARGMGQVLEQRRLGDLQGSRAHAPSPRHSP
jgi:hypothetical protein